MQKGHGISDYYQSIQKWLIHVYQGKRNALYLDYGNMLILVNITDMWYIYIDGYLLGHLEITDGLLYTIGGIL